MNSIVVFSGRAHPGLARAISRRLKIRLSPSTTSRFSNGCLGVQLEANCREADVFLIQPLVPPVQEHLMELLLMLDVARGASAARITAVIPHADRRKAGQASRFERGDKDLVAALKEMSVTTPVTLKITIVQPGVSRARISDTQLHLLSVTENYLMETYQLPFAVVTSE
jgi:ribose-phosphate pyrophosphokinase